MITSVGTNAGGSSNLRDRLSAKWIAVGALLVLAAVIAGSKLEYVMLHETTDDAYVDAQPVVVTAREIGTVRTMLVADGQYMRKGQPLLEMDDTDARADLAIAQQAVLVAQASLSRALDDAAYASDEHTAVSLRTRALAAQARANSQSLEIQSVAASRTAQATVDEIRDQQAALVAARAKVPAMRLRLENTRRNLVRVATLAKQGYVSQSQLELAQNDALQAEAAYRSELADVERAVADVSVARSRASSAALASPQARAAAQAAALGAQAAQSDLIADSPSLLASKKDAVQVVRAQLAAARQSLSVAKYHLSKTILRAPVDGYVATRSASIGQTLQIGDPGIVIMPSRGLHVTANFKETQLELVHPGSRADIHIDAYPHTRFYGHVAVIGAASQSALSMFPNAQVSGSFVKIAQRVPVRVVIDGGAAAVVVRPGMSAEVSVSH